MKYSPPLALAILLTACAVTPEGKEAARQRQLAKEARENFIAMKAQENPGRPVVLHDDMPPPTPKPKRSMLAFLDENRPSPDPAPPAQETTRATPRPKPFFASKSTPPPRTARNNDDTVYYWQVPPPRQHTTPRQQIAEAKYARLLAKRPEDLSPEERLWAHEHY